MCPPEDDRSSSQTERSHEGHPLVFATDECRQEIRWHRIVFLSVVYAGLWAAGEHVGDLVAPGGMFDGLDENASIPRAIILTAGLVLYAVLLAIPFVPGVEISIALLMVFGADIAPALYVATLSGLTVAFLAGKCCGLSPVRSVFRFLKSPRGVVFVDRLMAAAPDQKLEHVLSLLPRSRYVHLLKYRYLAVMIALNIPGNMAIGGGGGIALVAGASGLFELSRFSVAAAIAVLPVPLAIVMMGQ